MQACQLLGLVEEEIRQAEAAHPLSNWWVHVTARRNYSKKERAVEPDFILDGINIFSKKCNNKHIPQILQNEK